MSINGLLILINYNIYTDVYIISLSKLPYFYSGTPAAITPVHILYSCGYANNCRGYSGAEAWCQHEAVPASNTPQLNITSARITDSGVHHCCSVPDCCDAAAQSENVILNSTLNVTVYGKLT